MLAIRALWRLGALAEFAPNYLRTSELPRKCTFTVLLVIAMIAALMLVAKSMISHLFVSP